MGRGSSGNVSCATWKDTTRIFALKSFNNDKQTHKEILMLHRKVDIHENILQFYGITSVEIDAKQMKKYSLVLEYADSDTLSTYLSNHFNELNWSDNYAYACQNILIHQKNIKLTDFGLSKKIAEESSGAKKVFVVIPYIDPKSLMDQQYKLDKKSDIYSIGVLMWQISSGHQPFKNKGFDYDVQLSIAILNGLREEIIDETPFEYSNLYKECWKYELNNRPNIQEVVLTLKAIISSENRTANKYYSKEIAKNLSCKEAISDVIMDINKDYFVK
ncbi:kinase-like domain-containing protein [Rhizophagus clarus]|uniref:Kinase-like domain-containing protein n=1 Tax=Rhizophagus clarus TaxID=94130 RepID=A0A8H3MHG5_9GLOM|nr:kinase-like domain-containing protein [Rhizophagus clarus]